MKFENITSDIIGVFYSNNGYSRSFCANYCKNRKDFSIKKYGARKALELAINWRKDKESKYGKPTKHIKDKSKLNFKNKYKLNKDYFILKVIHKPSNLEYEFKFDLGDLDKIEQHYWYYNPNVEKEKVLLKTYFNSKEIYVSKILFPDKKDVLFLNHLNRNKFDYRRSNIIFEKSNLYRKAIKYKESEETIPGVFYTEKDEYKYWKSCYRKNEMNKQKHFNIDKYGYEKAKKEAILKRLEWEDEFDDK